MPDLADGQSTEVQGTGAKPYVLKNVGGHSHAHARKTPDPHAFAPNSDPWPLTPDPSRESAPRAWKD